MIIFSSFGLSVCSWGEIWVWCSAVRHCAAFSRVFAGPRDSAWHVQVGRWPMRPRPSRLSSEPSGIYREVVWTFPGRALCTVCPSAPWLAVEDECRDWCVGQSAPALASHEVAPVLRRCVRLKPERWINLGLGVLFSCFVFVCWRNVRCSEWARVDAVTVLCTSRSSTLTC